MPTIAENKKASLSPWPHAADKILGNFKAGWTPREQQVSAIKQIASAFAAGKRIVCVEMPTGGGKTPLAVAVADTVRGEGGSYLLTSQLGLMDQYTRDYPAPHMELLKGRSNYSCTHPEAEPGMDAGHGVCHKMGKGILGDCVDSKVKDNGDLSPLQQAASLMLPPEAHACPYWKQLQKANDAKLSLFNFSSFLFQRRIGRFQKRALLIIDEAHGIEGQLQNYVTVELSEWALRLINVEIDREITTRDQFVEWLREKDVVAKISKSIESSKGQQTEDTSVDFAKEEADALRELDGKIANFLRYLEMTEWILETVKYQTRRGDPTRKIVARPLYVKAFANDLLFSHADRVIVMSATILDANIWAESLGIKPEELEHVVTACEFPAKNRPVYLEFCGNLGSKHFSPQANPKNPTKPKFVAKIKQLLDRHQGQRGVIHCHSFELSKVLREDVASKRFLFQDNFGGDKQLMMSMHASIDDSVIVAPAMAEGFDFKDELARFQILAKVPWPSLGDRVIKERASRDDRFYGLLTALKIVQSLGRGCRHSEDWCLTYIVDSGFEFFLSKHGKMIPQWVKDAFKKYPPKPEELRRG